PGPGFKQANFGVGVGGWGIPIYGSFDFGISDKITIGPRIGFTFGYGDDYYYTGSSYNQNRTSFDVSFRGDYHYGSHIPALPEQLDLYGGVSLGASFRRYNYDNNTYFKDYTETDPIVAVQAGARWYFTENWGANAEVSGGYTFTGLTIGLS